MLKAFLVGERHHRAEGHVRLCQQTLDDLKIVVGAFNAGGHYHRFGLAFQLAGFHHIFDEVVNHDLGFFGDGFLPTFHIRLEFGLGFFVVELRIVGDRFLDFVKALVGGVVLQDIENEIFLNRLFHGIQVMRMERSFALMIRLALESELFQCFLFGVAVNAK